MKKEEQPELEPYTGRGGFWRPTGRRSHKAVKDTADPGSADMYVGSGRKRAAYHRSCAREYDLHRRRA